MLNETPFTETDKRKKIRARIREIRNHRLGLGDPVVIKRAPREERTNSFETKKNEAPDVLPTERERKASLSKETEKTTAHSRSSFKSKYANSESSDDTGKSEINRESNDGERSYRSSRGRRNEEESDIKKSSRIVSDVEGTKITKKDENSGSNEVLDYKKEENDVQVVQLESNVTDDKNDVEKEESAEEDNNLIEEDDVDEPGDDVDEPVDDVDEPEDDVDEPEDDVDEPENVVEDELANDEDDSKINGYTDDVDVDVDKNVQESIEDSYSERERKYSSNAESADEREDVLDKSSDQGVDNNEKEEERENYTDEEDYEDQADEDIDDNRNNNIDEQNVKRDRGHSGEDEEQYSDEEVRKDAEDEKEDYSDKEDNAYQEEDMVAESPAKGSSTRQDFSDDYSEEYSDQTQTDEGSSVSGRRFDEDQNLDDYELDKSSASRHRSGSSGYARKVEEAFKQKEPALAEGKSFKELLKKSDKQQDKNQGNGKKGAEQVDFRTVLRSTDKPKKPGDKSVSSAEQVDFRNLLQRKVQTKTLADKDNNVEQVDFRTVLKAGAPEKKDTQGRKVSNAEQLDFRNVLKKQPSVKSRKLSVEDKNALIKTIRSGRQVSTDTAESGSVKPGRPSLDSLREGGAVTKAKGELGKSHKESDDGECENKESRKTSRPSLDALKESGELGKTDLKKEKFEQKAKKAPAPVPPKPAGKKVAKKDVEDVIEEPTRIEEVEKEPEIETTEVIKDSQREDKIATSINATEKKFDSQTEVSERPRSRRRREEDGAKEKSRSDRISSQEGDDRKGSLKSNDKRARHRRLRQDQNEVANDVNKKSDDVEEKKETDVVEAKSKTSSMERVAVVQNTASRPTVQVILSTKSSAEKGKEEDSDEESIGTRRNRRRILRKGSVDEKETSRAEVKRTSTRGTDEGVKERRGSSTGSSIGDEVDGKPKSSQALKKDTDRTSNHAEKSTENAEDPAKARKAKMASLDAKLADRRRQRALESKERQQKIRNSRKAFRDQLDSNAPTTNGSASPSVQRANSNMTKLLHWCQRVTDGYPNVEVKNFTTSWNDGLAFCALLHNFVPDKIPFGDLTRKGKRENFEIAFGVASEEGVPELLEVEDMLQMECPDAKSVITYLHSIYQVFVSDRR
eukprot:gene15655-6939_t